MSLVPSGNEDNIHKKAITNNTVNFLQPKYGIC